MNGHLGPMRVIFLDHDNAIRSQMAEAFLSLIGGERFEVHSGGIDPQPVHPLTVLVMREIGYEIRHQEAKSAQRFFGRGGAFQVAILVSHPDEHDCPRMFPGALRVERWPNLNPLIGDPNPERMLERFRTARDRIKDQVEAWIQAQKDASTGVFSARRVLAEVH